ncbi:MAG: hypothetical protein IKI01_01120 [Lachnospiraceae bacterium]|nr:hypothetical protein [Lachnospiraceae bacterium]
MAYDKSALIAAKQRVQRLAELNAKIIPLEECLQALSAKEPLLAAQLRKEVTEREELSKKMRSSSLYSKLHRKEFVKELREADEAEAAYAQAGQEYEQLQGDLTKIEEEIKSLEKAEEQYRDMLYAAIKEVSGQGSLTGKKIAAVNDKLTALQKERTQIQKAITGSSEMVNMVTKLDEVLINMAAVSARGLEFHTWLNSIDTFLGFVKQYLTKMTGAVKGLSPDVIAMVDADKLRESVSLIKKGYTDTYKESSKRWSQAFSPTRLKHAIQLMYSGTKQLGNRLLSVSAKLREYEARIEGEYRNTEQKAEKILLGTTA